MGPLEAVKESLVEQLVEFPMHIKGNALEHNGANNGGPCEGQTIGLLL
jgi:hypothetical protein